MTRIFEIPKINRRDIKFETIDSAKFISNVVSPKKMHFMSNNSGITAIARDPRYAHESNQATSKFVMSAHEAFSEHIPYTISPEVIWTVISQELAQYVKDHSEDKKIAKLFTKNPDQKEKIVVEVNHFVYDGPNDWREGIELFRKELIERVPSGIMEYMTPRLSTCTPEVDTSFLVNFMDAASKYYAYGMMTCCGIPQFRIDGSGEDWDSLIKNSLKIAELIPAMKSYFDGLIPLLREIRNTADGNQVDNDFWVSFYKIDGGSGGPYTNGWLCNFYAHTYSVDRKSGNSKATLKSTEDYSWTLYNSNGKFSERSGFYEPKRHSDSNRFGGYHLNQFPSNLSNVPFEWNYYGTIIPMAIVSGITSVELDAESFLSPKLGLAVVEMEK